VEAGRARQLAVNNTLKWRRIVRQEPDAAKASDARKNPRSLIAAIMRVEMMLRRTTWRSG